MQCVDEPGVDGKHLRICPLCEAMCGLEIHVEAGTVTGIRGNPDDVWLHNVPGLMKGRDRCALLIHPDDAARYGISDTDIVTVKSEVGEIKVPVEVTDAIKPGVVSMPHWGHGKPGTRISVANGSPGANISVLSPPTFVDEPSGNGALNGIPVTIIEDQARFRPVPTL